MVDEETSVVITKDKVIVLCVETSEDACNSENISTIIFKGNGIVLFWCCNK